MMLVRLQILGGLVAVVLAGCGGDRGPERAIVSGTVTYRREPIKEGQIRFVPGPGSQMPVAVAEIIAGKYRVGALGGVAVGSYKIEVIAYHAVKARFEAPSVPGLGTVGPTSSEQYIPEKYNAKTVLEINVPPGSGEVTKNLDLIE
jgi:hypothetical protein